MSPIIGFKSYCRDCEQRQRTSYAACIRADPAARHTRTDSEGVERAPQPEPAPFETAVPYSRSSQLHPAQA